MRTALAVFRSIRVSVDVLRTTELAIRSCSRAYFHRRCLETIVERVVVRRVAGNRRSVIKVAAGAACGEAKREAGDRSIGERSDSAVSRRSGAASKGGTGRRVDAAERGV